MNHSVDPYAALASIFLPGGEDDGGDASTVTETQPAEPAPVAPPEIVGAVGGASAGASLLPPTGTTRPHGGRSSDTMPGATAGSRHARRSSDRDPNARDDRGTESFAVTRRGDGAALEVEMLVPGHLPIRAAAWLVPCVRTIAGADRAAALFRCDADTVELELHGPAPEPPSTRGMAEAIEAIRGPVRRWFLRPPVDLEAERLAESQPDRLTILTGGDPVAVASAWEVARRVISGADEAGWTRPQLGLAVVGVPRRQADLIAEQLDRITRERLGASVELRCCVPRIEPGGVPVGVVRGDATDADPVRLSTMVRGGESARATGRSAARPATGGPVVDARPAVARESGIADRDRSLGPLLGSGLADSEDDGPGMPFVFTAPPATKGPDRSAFTPTDLDRPTLARIVPPTAPVVRSSDGVDAGEDNPTRPEYARHVPGLRALSARSPSHPDVELAVDETGTLHVLGGVAKVRELPLVADWAVTHAELLSLACPDQEIDPKRRPQGHVFTDDPLAVSDLHQSQLHLHLLAEIEVDGRRGWFVSPLHRPRGT